MIRRHVLQVGMLSEPLRIPFVRRSDGLSGVLALRWELKEDRSAHLHISVNDHLDFQSHYVSRDLFECLTLLRLDLERQGVFVLCQGARVDVYPSGMQRDMGGGQVAYRMIMGKNAASEDGVDIFEVTADERLGTVEEQQQYWRTWMDAPEDEQE